MCLAWLLSAAEGSQWDGGVPRRVAEGEYPSLERLGAVGVVLAWQRRVRDQMAVVAVVEALD
jgi:hypothetical protein